MNISDYRNEVLDVLKQTGNHYPTKVINLEIEDRKINYHRWLHPYQGDWEIREVFTKEILDNYSKIIKPNSTAIDIGAHTGNMSIAYSLFADKVLSFEPNPAVYEVLEKNSVLNPNIHPFNYAISDEEGPLTFHYSDNGFCNGGFATRTNHGIGVTGHIVPIDVMAINFEKFIKENKIELKNVSLIKIDAEGHDKDILKTLTNVIAVHRPIIITEIYVGLNYMEMQDLLNTIHSLGYKAYDEDINKYNIDNLGKEIQSVSDIDVRLGMGRNLICMPV